MHNLTSLISAISALILAVTAAYKAFTNIQEKNHKEQDKKHKEDQHDMELYRHRWLEAEKGNDELKKEIKNLERKENKDGN